MLGRDTRSGVQQFAAPAELDGVSNAVSANREKERAAASDDSSGSSEERDAPNDRTKTTTTTKLMYL